MTRQEIEQTMDELAREYHDTHDPEIPEQIFELARRLKEMDIDGEVFTERVAPPLSSLGPSRLWPDLDQFALRLYGRPRCIFLACTTRFHLYL